MKLKTHLVRRLRRRRTSIHVAFLQSWSRVETYLRAYLLIYFVTRGSKSVAALLRVAGVTAGLAKSNGSLPPGF